MESRRKKEGEFYKLWWFERVEKMVVGNFVIDLRWEGKLGNRFTLETFSFILKKEASVRSREIEFLYKYVIFYPILNK